DLNNVWVLELGDGLRLRNKAHALAGMRVAADEHLESHGAFEGYVASLVHHARAAAPKHRLRLVAGNLWQPDNGRLGRAGNRARAETRKQGLDLGVDMAKRLASLPDLWEQVGAIVTHLFRRLARIEHLFEQFHHLRVAGHEPSSSSGTSVARWRRMV